MFINPEQVFGGSSRMLELIDAIYSTVQDASRWPSVLAKMSTAMQGESLALFISAWSSEVPSILALHDMPAEAWAAYAEYYAAINPIMPRCEPALQAGRTAYSHKLIPDSDLEKTEFYNDFFQPYRMHHSVGFRVSLKDMPLANFSCQREKRRGEFDHRAAVVYETLGPHLNRALDLYYQLSVARATSTGLEFALDHFGHAVLGLDIRGCVIFANPLAETLLREQEVLQKSPSGHLHAKLLANDELLRQAIADAVGGRGGGAVNLRAHDRDWQVSVSTFTGRPEGGMGKIGALVFVHDSARIPVSRAGILRTLFSLSPTEGRVVELLLQGADMRETAEKTGVTLETARFYTKSILSKTGVHRQTDLIRLAMSLPGIRNQL